MSTEIEVNNSFADFSTTLNENFTLLQDLC